MIRKFLARLGRAGTIALIVSLVMVVGVSAWVLLSFNGTGSLTSIAANASSIEGGTATAGGGATCTFTPGNAHTYSLAFDGLRAGATCSMALDIRAALGNTGPVYTGDTVLSGPGAAQLVLVSDQCGLSNAPGQKQPYTFVIAAGPDLLPSQSLAFSIVTSASDTAPVCTP